MSIAELKQKIILDLETADEYTLLQVNEVLQPTVSDFKSLPPHVQADINTSLKQIADGKTITYEELKKKHSKWY